MELTLAVIAGGAGRRLGGRVKGLLEVSGRPIIERLLELAGPADSVLIVTQTPEAFARFGQPMVCDLVPDKGAPGGVVTALFHARTEWVFAVASDMPLLERAHLDALVRAASERVDVVVATRDGSLEPLCALYRRSLVTSWQPALDANPSLRALIVQVAHVCVALPAGVLESVNTPEDLVRLGVR
ncbi:MAG: molybdenum cofactor guanylyltransferase [Myxococcales bacterium]|nr:molybdenum cofactor guanylyltransferase [Myxococcales bacterium]